MPVTSIWALSADGTVRCQLRLSEVAETVPYCSSFQQEKVSIPPIEGEMSLRFHGEKWTDTLEKDVKTNWINYVIATEKDAIEFQSAVFGRRLIDSFRTIKTCVTHEGLKGTFAFEEQFANIEMLRLWEDDGLATPGAQGGVLALMHVSSNFGEGWARWWMNCSRQQVKVRADGIKCAKLRGIDLVVRKPGTSANAAERVRSTSSAGSTGGPVLRVDTKDAIPTVKISGKKLPVKRVTAIKIEFRSEEERDKFVSISHRVQQKLIALPEL